MFRSSTTAKQDESISSEKDQFYFIPREPGTTSTVVDEGADGREIEAKPADTAEEAFEPKPVNRLESRPSINREGSTRSAGGVAQSVTPPADGKPNPLSRTLFAIFGGNRHQTKLVDQEGAKKVDAKLFFAVERTFLAWMKAAIMLAGFSIAVGSFTVDGRAQALYSLFFLAVAIALTVYCLVQYAKRSLMLVQRSPGPYEDKWGPVVLGSLCVFSLLAQLCISMVAFYVYS